MREGTGTVSYIADQPGSERVRLRLSPSQRVTMPSVLLLLGLLACSGGEAEQPASPATPDTSQQIAQAKAALIDADLDAAAASYEAALRADPTNTEAGVGRAYVAAMSGDLDGADKLLAAVQATAGAKTGEVQLRRALLAAQRGDAEAVIAQGTASGTPAGKLMAAEALLTELEHDAALELLREVVADDSAVGEAASRYLEFLEDEDPTVAAMAENYALWSMGEHSVAVSSVAPLIRAISESDWKNQELLVWAGRAAAVGEPQAASDLLESIAFAPKGQSWRVRATRAMIRCAEQDVRACVDGFAQLEGAAPPVGLMHAKATAAMVLDEEHREIALGLLDERVSDATARAALAVGDAELAQRLAPSGLLADFLSSR